MNNTGILRGDAALTTTKKNHQEQYYNTIFFVHFIFLNFAFGRQAQLTHDFIF
jgi:hypothetical protein